MIILDTDVLSELTRQDPDAGVLGWLDSLDAADTGTTAITAAELLYGVARLPEGKRKARLAEAVRNLLDEDLELRVAPFDAATAPYYALVVTVRAENGRPMNVADAQIAAICCKLDATLATRNIRDFEGTGIELLDPWRQR